MTFSASVCEPWAALSDMIVCTDCGDLDLLESQGGPVPDSDALNNLIKASNLLNRLTAFQFGVCEETVRPCCDFDICPGAYPRVSRMADYDHPYYPHRIDGEWYNVSNPERECFVQVCGPTMLPQIDLGQSVTPYPLDSIVQVLVDGEELPLSSVRIDDNRWVVRTDGSNWPTSQNLLLPDTEPGTWSITFRYGVAPPPEAVAAAAELACQLTLACAPPEYASHCQLPDSVTRVTRQGVSFDFGSIEDQIKYRRLNLMAVDRFISNVNPYGNIGMPLVISPTYGRSKHRRVGQ